MPTARYTEVVTLRFSAQELLIIDRAARIMDISRSQFIRDAALRACRPARHNGRQRFRQEGSQIPE